MAFVSINLSDIEEADPTKSLLFELIRTNFDDHESRLVNVETGGRLVPTGSIIEFAGAFAPTGYFFCDGTSLDRIVYADLFAVIQTKFGSVGPNEFNVPNMVDRTPYGLGSRSIGNSGGLATHTITTAQLPVHNHGGAAGTSHTHTITTPALDPHNHGLTLYKNAANTQATTSGCYGDLGVITRGIPINASNVSTSLQSVVSSSVGSGGSHNNTMPSIGMNYLIKT